MERKVFIYGLVDPRDGQIKYIGKTINPKRRLVEHLKIKETTKKGRWIEYLQKLNLSIEMTIIDEVDEKEEEFWEIHYISLFKSWGFDLKNHTVGGNNPPIVRKFGKDNSFNLPGVKEKIVEMNLARKGKTYEELYGEKKAKELKEATKKRTEGVNNPRYGQQCSENTKEKIGNANRGENNGMYGKHISEEHKERLREINTNKIVSEETKAKIRNKKLGKSLSEETKEKISKATSGENNGNFKGVIYQYSKDKLLIKEWGSLKEACEVLSLGNGNIVSCMAGRLKSAYGFIWTREKLTTS